MISSFESHLEDFHQTLVEGPLRVSWLSKLAYVVEQAARWRCPFFDVFFFLFTNSFWHRSIYCLWTETCVFPDFTIDGGLDFFFLYLISNHFVWFDYLPFNGLLRIDLKILNHR
jgi:hypothetical protein